MDGTCRIRGEKPSTESGEKMKKYNSSINLILIFAVLFGVAFKCSNDNRNIISKRRTSPTPRSPNKTNVEPDKENSNEEGFEDGHQLKGRFVNTDQGIRSFTFYTNGKFERGGADSGNTRGGEWVYGSKNSGTYEIKGKTLTVNYQEGGSEEFSIEIFSCCETPDYSLETPAQLKINRVLYTNVDD